MTKFDVIVIGAGHAGIEAATAAARMKCKVLLITQKAEDFGKLSCNPAIGGIGKGTIIKEIDALDGCIAKLADKAAIHKKILNSSKGPAVHGPRCQVDILLYQKFTYEMISNYENVSIYYNLVNEILTEDGRIVGIKDNSNNVFYCKSLVITTGTFLGGTIIRGEERIKAGRIGDEASFALSESLKSFNFDIKRLKTGTPPRIDINSINFEGLEKQLSDVDMPPMSFMHQYEENFSNNENLDCYITHTNEAGHNFIRQNKHLIPTLNGDISVKGPRYCPSIEDKTVRFAEKSSHQIFLEKQSLNLDLIYPNGISTSMSKQLQDQFFKSIKGFENIKIIEYGYAIEYDFVNPQEMKATLETKKVQGLFLAGQIIGTTGYEEAAGLGIVAGINAGLTAKNKSQSFILEREQSFIGVMIDDLITKGIDAEPYRMFTSRSEYRISCRPDNADLRLTALGYKFEVVSKERYQKFQEKQQEINKILTILHDIQLTPHEIKDKLKIEIKLDGIKRSLTEVMHAMKLKLEDVQDFIQITNVSKNALNAVNSYIYYLSDVTRQQSSVNNVKNKKANNIPEELDYGQIKTLSTEVLEKINKVKPRTIEQLERIAGVTPAAVASIIHYLTKNRKIIN